MAPLDVVGLRLLRVRELDPVLAAYSNGSSTGGELDAAGARLT